LSASVRVGVLQGRMGRRVNGGLAVQLGSAALRPLSEPNARACCQHVCLDGMGNWCPTRHCGGVRAPVWRHVVWTGYWLKTARANEHVVEGETETPRARWRLVVRGGYLLKKLPLSRRLVGEAPN
jgi:hypothetical protein